MTPSPAPLPPGTPLDGRYELGAVLGQGGFGITYEAVLARTRQAVVVKELAPMGSVRDGVLLRFDGIGPAALQRLRAQFDHEGRLLQKLRLPGLVRGEEIFQANGTSYLVMEPIAGAMSLERLAKIEGRMGVDAVLDLLDQALETLAELHARQILHRDLKPSNILVDEAGAVWLIDLGSAREWVADLTVRHTVLYTPGFAPLEQLSEHARRGPGTDLYGLAATAYFLLTGQTPAAPGEDLVGIRTWRPDVPEIIASAIEAALAMRLEERPASAAEWRQMLFGEPNEMANEDWTVLDAKLAELHSLRPGRMECPSCGDVLVSPKPAKSGTCIVCRKGRIAARALEIDQCPVCRVGILRLIENRAPLVFSPSSPLNRLSWPTGITLPWQPKVFRCETSGDSYTETKSGVTREPGGETRIWAEWREVSRRAERIWQCEQCEAQYDEESDGRRRQVSPEPKDWVRLFPEEWARVAKGLDPGAGNALCEDCGAEYFYEDTYLTLLSANRDPFDVLEAEQGRLMTLEQARWVGAGKASGEPGLACAKCHTEFDQMESEWTLVRTGNSALEAMTGQVDTLENWHRHARGLPPVGEETTLENNLDEALAHEFVRGEFSNWKSPGSVDGHKGMVTISTELIELSTLLKKRKWSLQSIDHAEATESDQVTFWEGEMAIEVQIEPMVLQLDLKSGRRAITLDAHDLVRRLQTEWAHAKSSI